MVGAYVLVSPAHAPPFTAWLLTLPVILAGSIAVTTIGWLLGLKDSWI